MGAKIKVELADGKKLKGSIESLDEEGFLLASNHADSPTRIAYDQVSQVKLAKITYHAKGQPDATEAKRVAAGLGVGHYIMVKTTEAKEYHGNIVAIAADRFTVQPDHTAALVQVAYNNVRQMGPNLSKGAKVAIFIGVCAAVWATVALLVLYNSD